MTIHRNEDNIERLIQELATLPNEAEWVEFKVNKADPEQIGQYISALANGAALAGEAHGYLVWGVDDKTHALVGTSFEPATTKVGNEELESWLLRLLNPKVLIRFHSAVIEGKRFVVLEIPRASRQPIGFQGQEWTRVGSIKKKLKDHPERERALWRSFDRTPFEQDVALSDVPADEVIRMLDYSSYFELMQTPAPATHALVLVALESEGLVRRDVAGRWVITNLGAILFAKQLGDFPTLRRKAVRLISYDGTSRIASASEREISKGYASGFEGLIDLILAIVPVNEAVVTALRQSVPMYPPLAIRELVANALIHQDFSLTGTGPMIELFKDRLEITNPGASLIDTKRLLDTPPRSRNETLASLMRRMGICEERGSGIDKVVFQTEVFQLPAPTFVVMGDSTRSVLFAQRPLQKMDREDRIRTCYLHACLKHVNHEFLTNTSIRERFGIKSQNSATASRYIKEALEAEMIVPADEGAAKRLMKYVPYWAMVSE